MLRSTKIVATLGPSSSSPEALGALIAAGVDVVRLNFSHGTADDHRARARLVRELAQQHRRPIGILVDLQGPKIRVGKFADGKITLTKGDRFILDAACKLGGQERVGLDYPELPNDVQAGDVLLLDDGRVVLNVTAVNGPEIHTKVTVGGPLSNNKGINRKGGGLSAPALTDKDKADMITAAEINADYLAISFPRAAADIHLSRELMKKAGGKSLIIAKIERTEAIENLAEILEASDGIMVARGDLGVEVGDAAVPALQKRMIRMAREMNKLAITATQMMESMISSPIPTRAEVSDVANAVLDGTDAVMLSAETASGQYTVETVEAMSRICLEAERSYPVMLESEFLDRVFARVDQSIAMAAIWTAHHLKVKAIAALTESGSTALWMSRLNCGVPIFALTPDESSRNRMTLFRDVYPMLMPRSQPDRDMMLADAETVLLDQGAVERGDLVVMTIGEPIGTPGGTNTLKIVHVGDHATPDLTG
ncbi:MAG: pyruvate kinase [Fluviibacter sp.]